MGNGASASTCPGPFLARKLFLPLGSQHFFSFAFSLAGLERQFVFVSAKSALSQRSNSIRNEFDRVILAANHIAHSSCSLPVVIVVFLVQHSSAVTRVALLACSRAVGVWHQNTSSERVRNYKTGQMIDANGRQAPVRLTKRHELDSTMLPSLLSARPLSR